MKNHKHANIVLMAASAAALCVAEAVTGAVRGDFNGDGFDDLVIGAKYDNVNGQANAGAVNVLYGSASGLTASGDQLWTQDSPGVVDASEANDLFGYACAAGDFNGDGFDDLAIGAPGENVGGQIGAGAVNVLYGSPSGLTASGDDFWTQNSAGVMDTAEAGDQFGAALATGDFDGDGFDDLAIGVPFEAVGAVVDAGAVNVLYGSGSGLRAAGNQFWNQDTVSVMDVAETGDRFGYSLAAGDFDNDGRDDLAIGVTLENIGAIDNAGAVNVLYGSSSGLTASGDQFWNQDSPGVLDIAEVDDHFGYTLAAGDFDRDGFADLAIGAIEESVGATTGAGAVNVLYGSGSGLNAAGNQLWTQDSPGVLDAAEMDDFFGSALAAGDFDGDGFDDLAIGVEFEDIGAIMDAGAVTVLYGRSSGLGAAGDQFWSQNSTSVMDTSETGDNLGFALAIGDFDGDGRIDLAIGAPSEDLGGDVDAGAVNVLYGAGSGLSGNGDQIWHRDIAGVNGSTAAGDNLGFALGP